MNQFLIFACLPHLKLWGNIIKCQKTKLSTSQTTSKLTKILNRCIQSRKVTSTFLTFLTCEDRKCVTTCDKSVSDKSKSEKSRSDSGVTCVESENDFSRLNAPVVSYKSLQEEITWCEIQVTSEARQLQHVVVGSSTATKITFCFRILYDAKCVF